MKAETDNLLALLARLMQNNGLIPVTGNEFIAALVSVRSSMQQLQLSSQDFMVIQNDLVKAQDALSVILYQLLVYPLGVSSHDKKQIIALTRLLLKEITGWLASCSDVPGDYDILIPPKQLGKALLQVKNRLSREAGTGFCQVFLDNYLPVDHQIKKLHFYQYRWWCGFAGYMLNNMDTGNSRSLEDILVTLGFNTHVFINFLAAAIKQQLDSKPSVEEKLESIGSAIIKFDLMKVSRLSYLPAQQNTREMMLLVLHTWRKCLPSGNNQSLKINKQGFEKINTALSVPQLALLVRLMVETKIINETNNSALVKNLASVVSTPKTPGVSAESLRVNYYTPGIAAKNIIREYLLNMVSLLRTY